MSDTVTLPNSARPAPLMKKRPRLHVLYSPQPGVVKGRAESLPVDETYIGRRLQAPHEGITLDFDPSLSSEHARFEVAEGDYHVTLSDLGSKNGTWLGATRLNANSAVPVRDGEVVRIGSTFLLLRYEPSKSGDAQIPSLIGTSLPMRELRARLSRLAPESAPVLLLGETGTGKELAARALHQLSRRAGELVVRNCAALPEDLIESELFGHLANAFTGAKARAGAFRSAHQGTLFLDEIGELPASQQARLLRAVEENQITPIGADAPIPCQARLIAATHRDLAAAVETGRFRQDLRARLAHLLVELPPLRARREDILLLLEHFYADVARLLTADLVHDLLTSEWRDNIRALRATADRLRIDGDSDSLREELRPAGSARVELARTLGSADRVPDAAEARVEVPPPARPYRLAVPSKEELVALLQKHMGTLSNVAKELNCSPRQARRWLEQHELDIDEYRVRPSGS